VLTVSWVISGRCNAPKQMVQLITGWCKAPKLNSIQMLSLNRRKNALSSPQPLIPCVHHSLGFRPAYISYACLFCARLLAYPLTSGTVCTRFLLGSDRSPAEETQAEKRLLAMEPPSSQVMSASEDFKDKSMNEWYRFLAPLPRVLLNSHPLPCFSSRLFLTVCPSAMRFQLFVLLRLLLQHPRLPVLFLVIDAAASPPA
jgi:hypothetical protein